MRLLLINPFHTGSHAHWCNGIEHYLPKVSNTQVDVWTLPGRNWKWRMHGSAGYFANLAREQGLPSDIILTTDMMDVAAFRGLLPAQWRNVPIVQYFHENQLTFPWNSDDPQKLRGQDHSYGFMNIQSCLAADEIWFNSSFHQSVFCKAVEGFLAKLPGETHAFRSENIERKSHVVSLGIEPVESPQPKFPSTPPTILWNHRWEYDKGPDAFLRHLNTLHHHGIRFKLILCGEQFSKVPDVFSELISTFHDCIQHVGYADSRETYLRLLDSSDFILHEPVQEYFGISVAEAMSRGVVPLLARGQAYESWIPPSFLFQDESDMVRLWHEHNLLYQERSKTAYQTSQQYFWPSVVSEIQMKLQLLIAKS